MTAGFGGNGDELFALLEFEMTFAIVLIWVEGGVGPEYFDSFHLVLIEGKIQR